MPVTNRAKPRYETKPTPRSKTWQRDIWRTAERLKTPLMPWQKKGARLLAELSEDLCICHDPPRPLPRYKLVVVSVCRQMGKTVLSRSALTTVAESEDDLEVYGTNLSRLKAAQHVVKLGNILKRLDPGVTSNYGAGNEAVKWPNGSIYRPVSPNEGGGHGDSIDFMLIDEGWKVESETMGGVTPAMIARPHSQMLVISTMGTVESTVWNGLVSAGQAVVEDPGHNPGRIAYIEYSAASDDEVFEDRCTEEGQPGCVWGRWMPALGITVSHADIRASIETLMADPEEGMSGVVRAFGNRTVATLVTLFPADWVERAWRVIDPPERMVLVVDVNEEPAGAAVATGHIGSWERDGELVVGPSVRLTEARHGSPRWVPEYCRQVIRDRDVEALVVDLGGPARVIRGELQQICDDEMVPLVDRVSRDFAADCQSFYNALKDGTITMQRSEVLEESVAGAKRKDSGDSGLWYINRRSMSVDASPVIAAIMAAGVAQELDLRPKTEFVFL